MAVFDAFSKEWQLISETLDVAAANSPRRTVHRVNRSDRSGDSGHHLGGYDCILADHIRESFPVCSYLIRSTELLFQAVFTLPWLSSPTFLAQRVPLLVSLMT